ncbi:MAG: fibronectin type III domain-containing protein [Clostridiales bacterium]|nr:fibronectin type III domain-containing protein [Clostridiales bacterium]
MKKLLSIIVALAMLLALVPVAVTSAATLTTSYLTIAPGADETKLNFSWHTTSLAMLPTVRIWKSGSTATEFTGSTSGSTTAMSLQYSNWVTVTGLEPDTEYTYQVGNGNGDWSLEYTVKTKNPSSFQFIAVGDAQIGTDNRTASNIAVWKNTLNVIEANFPNAAFMTTTGDQVDQNAVNATSRGQYDGFFEPPQLRSLPLAVALGNHEGSTGTGASHRAMYNPPNITGTIDTYANMNYWYRYGDVLFIVLDTSGHTSNFPSMTSMRTVISTATAANPDAKWRIINFHHDIYGQGAQHSQSNAKTLRDASLAAVIDDYNIDMVFNGHDHYACRSYPMKWSGSAATSNTQGRQPETFDGTGASINPTGTTYIAHNTPTDSKYYNRHANGIQPYTAWVPASATNTGRPQFAVVTVNGNKLTYDNYEITTTNALTKLDTYSIVKVDNPDLDYSVLQAKYDQIDAMTIVVSANGAGLAPGTKWMTSEDKDALDVQMGLAQTMLANKDAADQAAINGLLTALTSASDTTKIHTATATVKIVGWEFTTQSQAINNNGGAMLPSTSTANAQVRANTGVFAGSGSLMSLRTSANAISAIMWYASPISIESAANNTSGVGAYWLTSFSTKGYENLVLDSWAFRCNSSVTRSFKVEYSLNGTSGWTAVTSNTADHSGVSGNDMIPGPKLNLPAAMEDRDTVYLRFRITASSGNGYTCINDIVVVGNEIGAAFVGDYSALQAKYNQVNALTIVESPDGAGLPAGTLWMTPADKGALDAQMSAASSMLTAQNAADQTAIDNLLAALTSASAPDIKIKTAVGSSTPVTFVEWSWSAADATARSSQPATKGVGALSLYRGATLLTTAINASNPPPAAYTSGGFFGGTANGAYWIAEFSTVGYTGIVLNFSQASSSTGPRDFKVQWSTDNSTWTDVSGAAYVIPNSTTPTQLGPYTLPAGAENQPTLYVRWLMTSTVSAGGGALASGGSNRMHTIFVTGSAGPVDCCDGTCATCACADCDKTGPGECCEPQSDGYVYKLAKTAADLKTGDEVIIVSWKPTTNAGAAAQGYYIMLNRLGEGAGSSSSTYRNGGRFSNNPYVAGAVPEGFTATDMAGIVPVARANNSVITTPGIDYATFTLGRGTNNTAAYTFHEAGQGYLSVSGPGNSVLPRAALDNNGEYTLTFASDYSILARALAANVTNNDLRFNAQNPTSGPNFTGYSAAFQEPIFLYVKVVSAFVGDYDALQDKYDEIDPLTIVVSADGAGLTAGTLWMTAADKTELDTQMGLASTLLTAKNATNQGEIDNLLADLIAVADKINTAVAQSKVYQLVENASQVAAGDKVVIVAPVPEWQSSPSPAGMVTGYYAMITHQNNAAMGRDNRNGGRLLDFPITEGYAAHRTAGAWPKVITEAQLGNLLGVDRYGTSSPIELVNPSAVTAALLTVEAGSAANTFSFWDPANNGYLAWDGSGNTVVPRATKNASSSFILNYSSTTGLYYDTNTVALQVSGTTTRALTFNNRAPASGPVFGCYTLSSSGVVQVYLYKEVISGACTHPNTPVPFGAVTRTCVVEGFTAGSMCPDCDHVFTQPVSTGFADHTYGGWTTTVTPTCTISGVRQRTCSVCTGVETDSTTLGLNPANHVATESFGAVTQTCVVEGFSAGTRCVADNSHVIAAPVSTGFADHAYGDWTTTVTPTCTISGVQQRTCSVCTDVETDSTTLGLNPANHVDTESFGAVTQTCVVEGFTAGTRCVADNSHVITPPVSTGFAPHTEGAPATCTTAQICTVCTAVIVPAIACDPCDGCNGSCGCICCMLDYDDLQAKYDEIDALIDSIAISEDDFGLADGTKWMLQADFADLETLMTAAREMLENEDAEDQNEIDELLADLIAAAAKIKTVKFVFVGNYAALQAKYDKIDALTITVSEDGAGLAEGTKWMTADDKADLDTEMIVALAMLTNEDAEDQDEIDELLADLIAAAAKIKTAGFVFVGDYDDLQDKYDEIDALTIVTSENGKGLAEGTKWITAADKAELDDLMAAAEAMLENEDAEDQDEIDELLADLIAAANKIQTAVAEPGDNACGCECAACGSDCDGEKCAADCVCACCIIWGDADGNGQVNAADAAKILRALVQLTTLTPKGEMQAKVTGGATVSAADAAKILRFLVDLVSDLTPPVK